MIETFLLPMEIPLAEAAAARIWKSWPGKPFTDWSDRLVLVPTRHAGRRLREALAMLASREGIAIIPPVIESPEGLLSQLISPINGPSLGLASDGECLWAMTESLLLTPDAQLGALVQGLSRNNGFPWLMKVARSICQMRHSLSGNGLTISGVMELPDLEIVESDRWAALALLEDNYLKVLEKMGRRDRACAVAALDHEDLNVIPDGTSLTLIGIPEMAPVLARQIRHLSGTRPVEVWTYGDESWSGDFDPLGIPLVGSWLHRPIPDPEGLWHIERCLDPASMYRQVELMLRGDDVHQAISSLGVVDPGISEFVESRMSAAGFEVFNPAGYTCVKSEIFHFLKCWQRFLSSPSLSGAIELARIPGLARAASGEISQVHLLEILDRVRLDFMIDALDGVVEFLQSRSASMPANAADHVIQYIQWLNEWRERFTTGQWTQSLPELLTQVFENHSLNTRRVEDRAFASTAQSLNSVMESLNSLNAIPGADALDILLEVFSRTHIYDERMGNEVDLLGWMELLWEPEPDLPIAGFQDHSIPEAISADIFLPEKFRRRLGIPVNDDRLARDIYILHCLIESRRHRGSVTCYFSDLNLSGDPIRPSRLVFLCADEELPGRVIRFHGENSAQVDDPSPVFENSFRLRIPSPPDDRSDGHPLISRLSVTAFSSYLQCPFRFYLQNILGMDSVPRLKLELDPAEFGSLFHLVMESYGRNQEINTVTKASAIHDYLQAELDRIIHSRYGSRLPAALWIQRESLSQKLSRVAQIEAEQRQSGWEIMHTEIRLHRAFPEKLGRPWHIGGMEIAGTIDRVDRHTHTGVIRLMDFKTSNNEKTPADAHLITQKKNDDWMESRPQWQLLDWSPPGKKKVQTMVWVNLQLALYASAYMELYNETTVPEVCYFNTPRALNMTGLYPWDGFDAGVLESARKCAGGVVESIAGNHFLPPNPSYEKIFKREPMAPLFIADPESILDFRNLSALSSSPSASGGVK